MAVEAVRCAVPLTVLHVVNRLGDRGDGISNVCVDLACQQTAEGDSVIIATIDGGFTDLVRSHGVKVEEIDFRSHRPVDMVRAFLQLRRLICLYRPDIVHSHTLLATALGRLAVIGGPSRVIATVHNEYQRGVGLMAIAHCVVGVSEAVSRSMHRRGVPLRRLRTVLNGTVGSVRRAEVSSGEEPLMFPAIVAVGAVSHRKGADVLLEAGLELAQSDDAHVYFVGNIDWPEIKQRADSTSVDNNIHFLGFRSDPRVVLKSATIFVLASRRDPAPLVLIEALEAGVPIVASSVDGVEELLGHPAAGLLVPAGDAAALQAAIKDLLGDGSRRQELSARARSRAEDLSVVRVCKEYRQVYLQLIRRLA